MNQMPAKEASPEIEARVQKEEVFFKWNAPSRAFKRFQKEFYINIGAMAALIGLILFLIEGIIPAILMASVFFIFYVLTNYEPENVDYSLTSYGIMVGPHRIYWDEVGRYWFQKRFGKDVLIFETFEAPWRLELVVDSKEIDKIEEIVSKLAFLKDTPPNYMDKATNWVSSRIRM